MIGKEYAERVGKLKCAVCGCHTGEYMFTTFSAHLTGDLFWWLVINVCENCSDGLSEHEQKSILADLVKSYTGYSQAYYKTLIHSMPCANCGKFGVEWHHTRFAEGHKKSSNYLTIPACTMCHRTGLENYHNYLLDEIKGLAITIRDVVNMTDKSNKPF